MAFKYPKYGRWHVSYTSGGQKKSFSLSKYATQITGSVVAVTTERAATYWFHHWLANHRPEITHRREEIRAFFARYRRMTRPPVKAESTYRVDCQRLGVIEDWLTERGINYLAEVKAPIVDDLKRWLLDTPGGAGKPRSPRTVNRHLEVLRRVMNVAIRYELYPAANPVADKHGSVMVPERGQKRARHLRDAEVQLLEDNLPMPLLAAARLGYDAGLRRSEWVHLQWPDVDLDHGAIQIRSKPGFDPKSLLQRSIPLTPRLHYTLSEMAQAGLYVFDSGTDAPLMQPNNWYNLIVKTWYKRLGIGNGANLHSLRHTFATRLVRVGAPLTSILLLTGHQSIMALEPYLHADLEDSGRAIEFLSDSGRVFGRESPKAIE